MNWTEAVFDVLILMVLGCVVLICMVEIENRSVLMVVGLELGGYSLIVDRAMIYWIFCAV